MKNNRHGIDSLIYFTFGTIGDFLMVLSFLENIHEDRGNLSIHVVTTKNASLLRQMAEEYPFITVHELSRSIGSTIRLLSFIGKRNLVVTPQTFGRIPFSVKVVAKLLSFPRGRLVGYDDGSRINTFLYNTFLPFDLKKLMIDNLYDWLAVLGFQKTKDLSFRFRPTGVINKVSPGTRFVVIHPFAANSRRSLPESRWKELVAFLAGQNLDSVLITGSAGDREGAARLLPSGVGKKVRNLAGELSVAEMAGLLEHATLFVGVDTGITHLASVLCRPSVVIGNLSNPCWLPQYNDRAVILTNSKNCLCAGNKTGECTYTINGRDYLRCMIDVSQEEIKERINKMIT